MHMMICSSCCRMFEPRALIGSREWNEFVVSFYARVPHECVSGPVIAISWWGNNAWPRLLTNLNIRINAIFSTSLRTKRVLGSRSRVSLPTCIQWSSLQLFSSEPPHLFRYDVILTTLMLTTLMLTTLVSWSVLLALRLGTVLVAVQRTLPSAIHMETGFLINVAMDWFARASRVLSLNVLCQGHDYDLHISVSA